MTLTTPSKARQLDALVQRHIFCDATVRLGFRMMAEHGDYMVYHGDERQRGTLDYGHTISAWSTFSQHKYDAQVPVPNYSLNLSLAMKVIAHCVHFGNHVTLAFGPKTVLAMIGDKFEGLPTSDEWDEQVATAICLAAINAASVNLQETLNAMKDDEVDLLNSSGIK